ESQPEQERKQRHELSLDENVDKRLGDQVGASMEQDLDVAVNLLGRVKDAHIRRQNPKKGHATKNVDVENPLTAGNGSYCLRFRRHHACIPQYESAGTSVQDIIMEACGRFTLSVGALPGAKRSGTSLEAADALSCTKCVPSDRRPRIRPSHSPN